MSAGPEETLWPASPHTLAKQELYKRYLQAWLPILSLGGFPRLLVVDGFAGPGQYSTREDGSPIVALCAVLDHSLLKRILAKGTTIRFVFIEERKDRYDHLLSRINLYPLPKGVIIQPYNSTFEAVWGETMDKLESAGGILEPALVFVDPFGPSGFPMKLIKRLAEHRSSEVLTNFAYQPLNQWFLSQENRHVLVDELYGNDKWRGCFQLPEGAERERYLVTTYQQALADVGWRGVSFQMVNKHHQSQYYLLYGTKHHLGMRVFKDAAWYIAPDGQFQYSDLRNPAQIGFLRNVNEAVTIDSLAEDLVNANKGKVVEKSELEEFTDFHPTAKLSHLTKALVQLEKRDPSAIEEVIMPNDKKRRKGTFPDGCKVRFTS
ncbi:MAG: three-Cys-motif partner protein TcmP [Chloroflexi bacterium]|nr:three-Cys-motif partner protein TcmP [Chloroflexota bacterium]